MLGYLTSRWQGEQKKTGPAWFDRHFNPILLSVAKKACTHPIHTIVTIAFVASYSYLGVLDKGLLESGIEEAASSRVDFTTLLAGSKRLRIGEETSWQWEAEEPKTAIYKDKVSIPAIYKDPANKSDRPGTRPRHPRLPRIEHHQLGPLAAIRPQQCLRRAPPQLVQLLLHLLPRHLARILHPVHRGRRLSPGHAGDFCARRCGSVEGL